MVLKSILASVSASAFLFELGKVPFYEQSVASWSPADGHRACSQGPSLVTDAARDTVHRSTGGVCFRLVE